MGLQPTWTRLHVAKWYALDKAAEVRLRECQTLRAGILDGVKQPPKTYLGQSEHDQTATKYTNFHGFQNKNRSPEVFLPKGTVVASN